MSESEIRRELGLRIKAFRKELNLTQEKFGEIINLEWGNVSNIERGLQFPSIDTLLALISKAGMEPNYLLGFLQKNKKPYSNIDFEIIDKLTGLSNETKESINSLLSTL